MKLTNGRVVIDVRDDKADHYALMMGFHIVKDEPGEVEADIPAPRKPRGRPRKVT